MKLRRLPVLLALSLLPALAASQALASTGETTAGAQEGDAAVEVPEPVRGDLELSVTPLLDPIARRSVLRNDQNLYDVWLVSKADFEKVAEAVRLAISAKRPLAGGLKLDRWTWLEPDRSYVVDVTGGRKPLRFRLTRHLNGALVELFDAGVATDAPRWAPPYRPRPLLLPHGVSR